jgi:hypothetical protein
MKVKIIVISDTHGQINDIIKAINEMSGIDLIVHLGDNTKDAVNIKSQTNIEMINVKGNCDFLDNSTNEDKLIKIKDKRIFLTHGHRYGVKYGLNNLYYKAKEINADIVLFGHTHIPLSVNHDGIIFFNPGSITMPRGISKRSYGIIEVSDQIRCELKNL